MHFGETAKQVDVVLEIKRGHLRRRTSVKVRFCFDTPDFDALMQIAFLGRLNLNAMTPSTMFG